MVAASFPGMQGRMARAGGHTRRGVDRVVDAVAWSLASGRGTPEAGAVLAALGPLLDAEREGRATVGRALDRAERRCRAAVGDEAWQDAVHRAAPDAVARARSELPSTLAGRLARSMRALERVDPAGALSLALLLDDERETAGDLAARSDAVRTLGSRWARRASLSPALPAELRAARRDLERALVDATADAELRYELVAALAPPQR